MNTLKLAFNFLAALTFSSSVFAASITQVKNGKALINLDGENLTVGTEYFAVNEAGKKMAILKISAVKNGKAIGHITKGTADVGFTVQSKSAAATAAPKSEKVSEKSSAATGQGFRWERTRMALAFKLTSDSISAKESDNSFPVNYATADMKGNNFGASLLIDFPYHDWLSFRFSGGIEMLKVNGKIGIFGCEGKSSTECDVNINYLALGGMARYTFNSGSMQPWIGAGAQIKQPLTKKSTALKEENIQMATAISVGGGIDYHLSSTNYIPMSVEMYKSMNTSDTVPKIDQLAVQIGYGWNY